VKAFRRGRRPRWCRCSRRRCTPQHRSVLPPLLVPGFFLARRDAAAARLLFFPNPAHTGGGGRGDPKRGWVALPPSHTGPLLLNRRRGSSRGKTLLAPGRSPDGAGGARGRGLGRLGCSRSGTILSLAFPLGRIQSRARAPVLGVRAGRVVRPRPASRVRVRRDRRHKGGWLGVRAGLVRIRLCCHAGPTRQRQKESEGAARVSWAEWGRGLGRLQSKGRWMRPS
jgi:hypothetical protein